MAAEMVGLTEASEQAGIPKSTVAYWLDDPKFEPFRTRTRENLGEAVGVVAHLAWQRVGEALRDGTMEPRDALFAAEKATTLLQLLSGQPTSRAELRDITDTLDDHERATLRKLLDDVIAEVPA